MAEIIQSPSARLLMLGAGRFLINEWDDDGVPTYYRQMGNIGSGELTQTSTRLTIRESMTRNRDVYLDLPKDQTFELRVTRAVGLRQKNVARALQVFDRFAEDASWQQMSVAETDGRIDHGYFAGPR